MTQISGKVQTQPDGGGSKRRGEARATKGSGNGSRRQAPSPGASAAQEHPRQGLRRLKSILARGFGGSRASSPGASAAQEHPRQGLRRLKRAVGNLGHPFSFTVLTKVCSEIHTKLAGYSQDDQTTSTHQCFTTSEESLSPELRHEKDENRVDFQSPDKHTQDE